MENKLGFHAKAFNAKVKAMNQTHSKNLTMNADDARNLHSEIFDLLARITELKGAAAGGSGDEIKIVLDGDKF